MASVSISCPSCSATDGVVRNGKSTAGHPGSGELASLPYIQRLHSEQQRRNSQRLLYPSVEWVQSFADERCGRAGVVYQASNFDFIGSHESTFYELDGEWYHEITMNAIKRGGQRGVYLRANKERAVVHKFNQYRYIRFLNKRARKRLNTKLFKVQPYPK